METPRTRIELCGRLLVEIDGEGLHEALPGRQGRLLFAYLVLNRDRPVRRDELVDALWSGNGTPSWWGARRLCRPVCAREGAPPRGAPPSPPRRSPGCERHWVPDGSRGAPS